MSSNTDYIHRLSPSLDAFEATMSGLLRPCRIAKRTSSTYSTEITHGRMSKTGLTSIRIGGNARIAVEAQRNLTLVQIPLAGRFVAHDRSGSEMTCAAGKNAQLVFAENPIDLEFSSSTKMLVINLSDAQIDNLGDLGVFEKRRDQFLEVSIDAGPGLALCRLATFLTGEIEANHDALFDFGLGERLEDCLMSALCATVGRGSHGNQSSSVVPSYVKRAERFMAENLDQPITLADIVSASGTSERTLHRTFRETRGGSPLTALKNMRLERVHAELRLRKTAPGDITRIAMEYGFNHMGLFAADYRNRYGTSPSVTARDVRL